ncbi:hypothetical protein ACH4F6_31335 [Streptomyces sp. NPDC017936]|uniref:hypothetical protein n=1 Tax=Streptomyces sp. NPDC017936 TaxID=3365016 RepID=UPI0037A02177
MDERRDPPPAPQPGRPILAAATRLSPLQQAYAAYTDHAVSCDACRDVDRTCAEAEALWRAYRAIGDDACERLASEA